MRNEYEEALRTALDITIVPGQKLPRLHKEGRFKGLYLICSQEEDSTIPFLRATGPTDACGELQLAGKRVTLEEAAKYLQEQNVKPVKLFRRIKRLKGRR